MPLEILHRPLMAFGRGAAGEGAEIAPPPGLRVYFARVEPVFAGGQLADHGDFSLREIISLQPLVPPQPANRPPARTRSA